MRRTRQEATEANRAAVLAAARRQFEQLGYHGATLDSIAADAGFSKGVVYSQFGSKDDLFLAVLEVNIKARKDETARQSAHLHGPEDLPRLVEIAFRQSTTSLAWQAALLEFRVYAWRHPAINQRYVRLHERTVAAVSELLSSLYQRGGIEPPLPARQMALAFLAGGAGVVAELLADPTLGVTDLIKGIGAFSHPVDEARVGSPS
jgi:AcrR family transcriptional regulator